MIWVPNQIFEKSDSEGRDLERELALSLCTIPSSSAYPTRPARPDVDQQKLKNIAITDGPSLPGIELPTLEAIISIPMKVEVCLCSENKSAKPKVKG